MAPLIPGEVCISNKKLIHEVQKRPALYDRSMQEYTNQLAKTQAWKDIAENIFSDQWSSWTRGEQDAVSLAVQKRWMNLRSCFARELRKQIKYENGNTTQDGDSRRRKYRYYKNMMFLQKHTGVVGYQGMNEIHGSEGSDNQEDWQGQNTENSYLEDDDSESDYSVPIVPIKKEKKEFEIVVENPLEELQPKHDEPVEIRQNPDQDINFVMSLVPMLRELPVSQKLKIQVDILKLFQQVVKK